MVDFTMCSNKLCPLRARCYKATAQVSPLWQSWAEYDKDEDNCFEEAHQEPSKPMPNMDCIHLDKNGRCSKIVEFGSNMSTECSNEPNCCYYVRDMRLKNLEVSVRKIVREEMKWMKYENQRRS